MSLWSCLGLGLVGGLALAALCAAAVIGQARLDGHDVKMSGWAVAAWALIASAALTLVICGQAA